MNSDIDIETYSYSFSDSYNTNKILSNTITEIEIEKQNRTELIQNMINNLFEQLDISYIDSGKDKKIVVKNLSAMITSTKNQKNNENENMIIIDLCECENILKQEYNTISKNDSLYILLIILEVEGMKIPKVEYEVYYPSYNNNNLTKLNLTLCKGRKIHITIPVKINETIDKHNPSSDYYNDICCKTTSKSGTDISLKDRRNEFVENNITLCEEKCKLIDYNYNNEKVKCSCDVKTNISPNHDLKFNKNEFYKSFTDIKNIANINILICYKIVFDLNNLINNYGLYNGFYNVFIFHYYFYFLVYISQKIKSGFIKYV